MTSAYAVKLANAVAASYVTYIGHLEGSTEQAAVTALQHESNLLTEQINDLQSQIDTVTSRLASEGSGSRPANKTPTFWARFESEQNQVSLQLNRVTGQITNTQLETGSTVNTTRILQKATTQPASKVTFPIEAGIIGILIGLLGSTAFVLMRLQSGHKLRLRDEIARVAGAPVIASLESARCITLFDWRALLEERPRATDEWALRHLLRTIPTGGGRPQAIRVISFADDSPAMTTGPRLALQAAGSGTPTALFLEDPIVPGGTSLAPLRAAFTGAQPVGRDLPITLGLGDTDEAPFTLIVTVAIFDGNSANLTSSDAINLLSISPNFVTADELARLALAAADSGFVLDGVVVVNPDPTDNTTGSMRDDTLRLLPSPRTYRCRQLAGATHTPAALMMSTTLNDEYDEVVGPTIGLRGLMATLRRKRRIWLVTGLVGLIVGASLHFVIPPKFTAETDLYLTVPAGANPMSVTANNVSLLKTQVVAQKAIADGHLHTTPNALLSHYSGLSVSDNIMSIKFSGSTKAEAVAGAKAVAKAFLAVQASELGLQTNALVRGLHSQIASLNTEIDTLNSQISNLSGTTPGTQSSNRLTDLVNLRSEDESQLFTLQTQVQQALLNEHSTDHSNSVLDPAAIAPVSTKKVVVVDALSGLVAGLAIGIAAVIFGALLSERPLDRSTVAATLGAPVELSLERYRSPRLRAQETVVSKAPRRQARHCG